MSELIAEARVLVTPDTTTFRALLTTELTAIQSSLTPVTVPVTPVVAGGGAVAGKAAAATKEAAAAEAAITKLAQAENVLTAADQKMAVAATQAGAARTQFSAATRAASIINVAYTKALASGDEELIEAVALERQLANARRDTAVATLRAAQATAAETAATKGAVTGQAAQVAGARARLQSVQGITASAAAATAAQNQLARATTIVEVAERRALAATSEASAAKIRYGATVSATATTFAAYNKALQSNDLLLVKQTRDAYAAAKGNEALALSNLDVARTEAAKTAALTRGTTAQAASLRQLSTGAGSAAASLVGVRGATLAATGPFLAGAAGAIALSKSIQLATSFNSEIAVLGATTGATGEQLTTAAAAAREFGRDITLPGVTAGDAAKTITEFAKAGLDLNDSIAATRGGLQLAQAAQLSYADSVTLTANALNAFGLSGNQAVRVADTLANASNLAQGGIEDTALALRQAAGAAAVVGVSFEDTTALLTLLARNGLTGSDAGTALRTAFLRLVNPSKEANAIIKDLNINLRDAAGNVRPEVFAEFARAQEDLSVATQQANAAIVFGQDAFRAFGFLAQEGTEGLTQVQDALTQTGTAARIAQARMTGLAGAQENLSNQLSALGETIGQAVTPALTGFVNQLAGVVAGSGVAVQAIKDLDSALNELPGAGIDRSTLGFLGDSLVSGLRNINPQTAEIFKFLDAIKDSTDEAEKDIKNGGVALRSALEDSGREAARGAVSFSDQIVGAINQASGFIRDAIARAQSAARGGALRATARGAGQESGLEEVFNQIVAGGGSVQAQIANLRQRAEVQAKIISDAGPDAAGVLLERRREARSRLAQINQQITSLEEGIAADQEQAAREQQRIREDANRARDRSFLQAQEDARTRQERQITLAEDTPQLADDIRRQEGLRALIQRQIAALKQSAVDEQTKEQAIRSLRIARDATTDELKRLEAAQREQRQAQREAAREAITENLDLRTQIAEAQGNDNAVLAALNNQIRDQRKRVAAYKKGTTEFLREKLALEQMLEKRRDLLESAEDDLSGGKSLAEFLTENTDLFGSLASSGGLTGIDPFSGFDFSSSIVSATKQMQQAVKAQQAPQQQNRLPDAIDRLIAALERNTDSKGGNESTGGVITNGGMTYANITGQRAKALGDFWQARQARQLEEARYDGGSAT